MTRSKCAARLFAAVHALNYASALRTTINDNFGKLVLLTLYKDSKSLFDGIFGLYTTTEKRIQLDLSLLKVAYELSYLSNAAWIAPAQNPADAMTKATPSMTLQILIEKIHLVRTVSP